MPRGTGTTSSSESGRARSSTTAPDATSAPAPGRAQDWDLDVATHFIAAADPEVAAFIDRAGPYAPRPGEGDALASLARAIVFQQLATRAAAAIHRRFVDAIGGTVTAGAILATPPDALRAAGLSNAKTVSLLDLAAKVADGTVPLDQLPALGDDEIVERLVTVRGIGRWTAEMFLLFELRRPDVWPVDDLGVRHGWRLIHGETDLITPKALLAEGERFRPYRTALALFCWHAVHVDRGQVTPRPGGKAASRRRTDGAATG